LRQAIARVAGLAICCAALTVTADPTLAGAPEWTLSMAAGAAGADDSSAVVQPAGGGPAGESSDFSAFILLGIRGEAFPRASGAGSRHFGLGLELMGLAGEADIETTPGAGVEEVTLVAGVITPSLIFRFGGRSCEAYVGAGPTLVWGTRLSDVAGTLLSDDDVDIEAPLGIAAFAGVRWTPASARWFLLFEGRYQSGENDFTLSNAAAEIHLDWRTTQFLIGSGYRF